MGRFGLSQPVRRSEDHRFLTGSGRYTADISLPSQVHAVMLRSPHAHARLRDIDVRPALALPGVLMVATAQDLAADGLGSIRLCGAGERLRRPADAKSRPAATGARTRPLRRRAGGVRGCGEPRCGAGRDGEHSGGLRTAARHRWHRTGT